MGPGFTDCGNSIYGFGDSTAGPIWHNSLQPKQPLFGGEEMKTNYPYGESLYNPVGFAATIQTVAMNTLSKVTNPVCAYNLYNIFGYLTTGIITYLFVVYLTRSRWIAALAGYAVSFSPYVQSKIGGHPNYAFAGLLVAILWLFVDLIRRRKILTAILLGFALAICAYLDPYFSLLALTVTVPSFLVWLIYTLLMTRAAHRNNATTEPINVKRYVKLFGVVLLTFAILLAPLVVVRIKDSSVINQSVTSSRGNILAAAQQCSNMPTDYLLPDPTNIYLVHIFGTSFINKNIHHRQWCGYAESRVSISLTLLLVIATAGIVMIWRIRKSSGKKAKLPLSYDTRFIVIATGAVAIAALLIGLPPHIDGIIMPSDIILKVTTMWRIFAREYLVVNLSMVILAAIAMAYLTKTNLLRNKKWLKVAMFFVIFAGVLCEYQINPAFHPLTFNYSKDVPSVYKDIKSGSSIKVIAEYPMDRIGVEYDSVVYYMTMQSLHQKSMVNSVLSTDSRETTHAALKDLSDPQTIPALRYLGVDHVVVHGENVADVMSKTKGQLTLVDSSDPAIFGLKMFRDGASNNILLFKINPGVVDNNIVTIESGEVINLPLIQSPVDTQYEILNNAVLQETPLGNAQLHDTHTCFDVRMSADSDSGDLNIYSNNQVIRTLHIAGTYTQVQLSLSSGEQIKLVNDKGYNMRINNLNGECSE